MAVSFSMSVSYPGKPVGLLDDDAGVYRVVVAPGDERGPRRRAERRRVEGGYPAPCRDPIDRRVLG